MQLVIIHFENSVLIANYFDVGDSSPRRRVTFRRNSKDGYFKLESNISLTWSHSYSFTRHPTQCKYYGYEIYSTNKKPNYDEIRIDQVHVRASIADVWDDNIRNCVTYDISDGSSIKLICNSPICYPRCEMSRINGATLQNFMLNVK